ncbi:mediator of RNA polymerase II transcription subunit 6 [[Candida] jaroonii]|uniref:Mediator of RNA polymerase II transcription subunit 6 n=1 Tax=[Candida] jaroonii TaxID=467808 RepID=A0ACA9YG89_9ASCO|nr:mediator of RNA polymerase II transcription subunit 6 [[Candida] jaroonii]
MDQPLDEIQWKIPEWINQFGLHTGNVLDYFSESPFYDRTSNNQVIKMQFQFQPPPPNIQTPLEFTKYFENKLIEMVGIEFIIAYVREPDFWIIRKQNRLNKENVQILNDYYIIGANIYQSPKIYDLLSSRLLNSTLSIKNSINLLNQLNSNDEKPVVQRKPRDDLDIILNKCI